MMLLIGHVVGEIQIHGAPSMVLNLLDVALDRGLA